MRQSFFGTNEVPKIIEHKIARLTADVAIPAAAITDITEAVLTATLLEGIYYRWSFFSTVINSTADISIAYICDENDVELSRSQYIMWAGTMYVLVLTYCEIGYGKSVTRKVRASVAGGTTTYYAAAPYQAFLMLERMR